MSYLRRKVKGQPWPLERIIVIVSIRLNISIENKQFSKNQIFNFSSIFPIGRDRHLGHVTKTVASLIHAIGAFYRLVLK